MIFNHSVKKFCKLDILNKWTNNYTISKIPNYEIISEVIGKIIKENQYNKKVCLSLIKEELNIIKNIRENEKKKLFNKIEKENRLFSSVILDKNFIYKMLNKQNKREVKEEKKEEEKEEAEEEEEEEEEDEEENEKDLKQNKEKNIVQEDNKIKVNRNNLKKENIDFDLIKQNTIIDYDIFNKKNNIPIEEELIYLPFLDILKKVLNSIKIIIELFKVTKTRIYEKIKIKYDEIINKDNKLITLKEIRKKIEYLDNLNENININILSFDENDNSSLFVDFLTIACNNEEGIKFAFEKTNEEIKALSEFVGESENSKIQIRDIQDFMNVCNFFETIKAFNIKYDFELIEEFKAAFLTMESFGTSFKNYLINFKEIKNVYEEYLDKPEVSRKKIEQILKASEIKILFDDNSRLIKIIGNYIDIFNNRKNFDNNDLQELHDRALLFTNKAFDNMRNNVTKDLEQKQENSKKFVEIVEHLNILVSYLNALYIKGYPNNLQVELIIEDSVVNDIEKKKDIKNIINYYKDLTIHLENAQTESYKEKPLIRLIFGQQFYDIYNYYVNFNKNIDIIPLLKKISDNKIMAIPKLFNIRNIKNNDFKTMINEINDFLNECLIINHIEVKDFYRKNIIKEELRQKIKSGFFSWSVDEINTEIQIISVYKKLTGNLPLPITLLLCTKETNEEEITSFIYRTVLCSYPALFIIVNSDNLELSNAQYFLWILESLYNKNKTNIQSTLLILFNNTNSDLRKQLTLLKGHDFFMIDNNEINEIEDIKNDFRSNPIKIWSSDAAGIGKSFAIKFEAKQSNLKYIYFPIGGSFTRKELINRITKLEMNKENYEQNYLHIDIYDSDKESSIIIKEFLFSLLITRNYTFDEKIFYLGYGSKISIEIPNGFYDMKDKFKLLNYFTLEKLSITNLPNLIEIEDEDTNYIEKNMQEQKLTDIQLVTYILIMLEKDEIEDNLFDIEKNNKKISLSDCQKTIDKYFTLKKGNYYQKMAFIHILADQFRKFCSSIYLDPKILIENQNSKVSMFNFPFRKINRNKNYNLELFPNRINNIKNDEKITKVRKIMIENLIKLTLYFVKGPYNKIVLNQKTTKTQLFDEFNENKINEIANQSLSNKDEIISFEKINPSLVFFNEDIQTFSIITTSKRGDGEYNQLLQLYNSQLELPFEKDSLIDYRNLTHEEFLPEVKNILNLNTLSIEQIKEIIGSYCFTSDNFIKMILILLRTRAGIPVLMMGETGCGKTSLIKILSTLLNKGKMNMKIKNIHAGIKDQDIIEFIEEVNNEANKEGEQNNPNEKIWVFFDEINTCNSMGLLSEIFYKHSYYGKKLNDKLTFIAACNPYRLKVINKEEKETEDFCLNIIDKNYYYSKQKLVYLVNPLPHSLLSSIFDFGNLSSKDEKKYIQSIVKETIKKYKINKTIEKLMVDEILVCQNYIRAHNDVSSVSLRELRRFNILFAFFVDYLQYRDEDISGDIYIYSLCLCLYFCYFIRLSNNKLRKELENIIKDALKDFEINNDKGKNPLRNYKDSTYEIKNKEERYFGIIQREKKYIASQVKIPQGIARNSTLLENIFSLFVCIVNKIPLIICGKPGTSKSLSFQILYDSMKGDRSENSFFKNYPELLVFSYQGSKTSTSEGIQKVFNKARNCLKKNKEKNKKNKEKNNNINNFILNKNKNSNNIIKNNKKKINTIIKYNIKKSNNYIIDINDRKTNKINSFKEKKFKFTDEVIPVLYFDEMGLAEESPNNPLKVIHSELEYDDNELKIGFVGISNWRLDASKMNRTIFLGVPPLEESDLMDTAKEISSNLDYELSIKYQDLFSNLVKTYCKYKKETKPTNQREFHGLRDFYHLIKNAMNYLLNEKKALITNTINYKSMFPIYEEDEKENENENSGSINEKSYKIGIKSLLRNFDGLKEPFNSFEKIKKIFDGFYPEIKKNNYNYNLYNVFDCLKDNIKDNNSRYLLIIMESSMSIHLLSYIMQELEKKYIFYSGSQLKDDLNKEKYVEKLLNKIQLSLENGDILVLKNMENIYPSLYNLFNQNFTMLGGKKFARIAFANYKSYSVVHDDFRAIVLVDEEQIKEKMEDPPFLNRFEKHAFSFDFLMNDMELKITKEIINYIDLIVSYNNKDCKIDLKRQILWYNKEEIKGIIFKERYKKNNNKDKKENDLYDIILKYLSKLFSQDILASIISIDSELKAQKMPKGFLNCYQSNHIYNFKELFELEDLFVEEKNTKIIIYTFSKLLQPCIKEGDEIHNDTLENLISENVLEKIVNSIKNEMDLENILDDYYNDEEKKILILKFTEDDLNKMNQIKIKINQYEIEKKNNERYQQIVQKKHFIFLICLTRQKLENKDKISKNRKIMINDLISNIDEEYNQFFIDNLHGKKENNIINIMSKNPSEYINEFFNNNNSQLLKIFYQIFSFITFEFKNENLRFLNNSINNINRYSYIKEIINKLYKNEYILKLLKEKIGKEFGGNINKIIKSIFIHGNFEKSEIEFVNIIYKVIFDKIYLLLFKFIFKSEKDHFLNPLLLNYDFIQKQKENLTYIETYINNFDFSLVDVVERINSNQILLILNLYLPLSKKWYELINIFIENNIKADYIYNEENLRLNKIEENKFDFELDKYSKRIIDFMNKVKGEILRIEGLNEILKTKNIDCIRKIYIDFMIIFLTKKFNNNIDIGIQFLDILIQLKLNISKENKYSFIDNNKKVINLQDNFVVSKSNDKNNNKININKNEELNIKYDEDTLSKILLFLICYNDEIYSMLEIFYSLNKYFNNFYNDWKDIISRKEIKYEINKNIPIYTREVNESFYIIFESLIKSIFDNPDKYRQIPDGTFYEYLDYIQKLSKMAIQIYYKLYLPSKEMYTLQILINIFESFNLCKNKKNINKIQEIFIDIINNINKENNYIINKNYEELEDNYASLQIILENLIDKENNEKEYSLLLNNIFIYRFNKSLDNEYRKKISIIFFKRMADSQLKYILPILKKLIDDVEPLNLIDKKDLTEKECVEDFMKCFINVDNNKKEFFEFLNNINNDNLNLNVLYYFECECELYFRKISNKKNLKIMDSMELIEYMNNILLKLSFKYFKKAMSYYLDDNEFDINATKIGKIFCIAYIKNYLKKLAEFLIFNINKNILNFDEILKGFLCQNNSKKIFTLKIFLFKCLFKNENKNYIEFIDFIRNKNDIQRLLIHDDLNNLFFSEEIIHSYNYSFIDINSFEYYCTLNKIINSSIDNIENNENFNSIEKYIKSNITNNKGFDLFYNILVNRYILDLYGKFNNTEDLSFNGNKLFNKFTQLNINISKNSQILINYIINKNLFTSKIIPKLKIKNNGDNKITSEQMYILLFCVKFFISLQLSNKNLFLLFNVNKNSKNDLIKFLKENYIPGSFEEKNEFIESYYEIDKHLKNQPSNNAIYICSCGKCYNVPPCGFPTEKSNCVKCNLAIGGKNHKLVKREGHYRIFLDEESKEKEFSKSYADKSIPYKYLNDFKIEVIDPLLNIPSKGIGKMTKEIINETGNNIRNINELTFRILNFILYSHLLIANILDILDDNDISKFFSEETSCFGIILDNWSKMVDLLNNNGINNIQIYLNIIYEKIINILIKYDINDIKTYQGRDIIEKEINNLIKETNNIKENIKTYEEQNNKIINSSADNISSLIQELYPKEYYQDENQYPYYKYLYYYNYPNIDNLYNIIKLNNNYKNKYPLTFNILKYNIDNKKEIDLLKYIPKVNNKLNHLIQNYSYKISRDE